MNKQPAPRRYETQAGEVVEPVIEISEKEQKEIVVGYEIMTAQAPLAELLFSKSTDDKNLEAWTNTYSGESPAELFRTNWTAWRAKEENQGELKGKEGKRLFKRFLDENKMYRFTKMKSDQKPLY